MASVWSGTFAGSSTTLASHLSVYPPSSIVASVKDWDFDADEIAEGNIHQEICEETLPVNDMPPSLAKVFNLELEYDPTPFVDWNDINYPIGMISLPSPASKRWWCPQWCYNLFRVFRAPSILLPINTGSLRAHEDGVRGVPGITSSPPSSSPALALSPSDPDSAPTSQLNTTSAVPDNHSTHSSRETFAVASPSGDRILQPQLSVLADVASSVTSVHGRTDTFRPTNSSRPAVGDELTLSRALHSPTRADWAQGPALAGPTIYGHTRDRENSIQMEVDTTDRDLEAGPRVPSPTHDVVAST